MQLTYNEPALQFNIQTASAHYL
uniref:Uncharacterized protein n=1 Tax=Arundo donax TaxID=35708 RepID=A0A0A9GS03_ARUDO